MNATDAGKRAEAAAQQYLMKKGYAPLAQNYRAAHKEIDLIMLDGDVVVFVEVKARKNLRRGMPGEAVDRKKRRNLTVAATAYLMERGWTDRSARFDVVELWGENIRHTENAFPAEEGAVS